ncbi:MAG: hypothetical protein C3F08_07580 [Candidatus Methylomirabilota bacterium]|nr:MAG: hypothetical protein C3F08_07580 [candidate division NC10 bacterium]
MRLVSRSLVDAARSPSPWDFGNEILYELCRKHPFHRDIPTVIAKIWLIGRSYAAAIERRKKKDVENDAFYVDVVAPAVIKSKIDTWIEKVSQHEPTNSRTLDLIVSTHAEVTSLFNRISGLGKRSLASKYLHFHRPNHFYIYDTRAIEGMRKLSPLVGRASSRGNVGDNEYRKFAEKCARLQASIKRDLGISLNPRQIDKLLLAVCETEP